MQFQAGTKKSALQMHPLIVTVCLTSSVVCIVPLSHTPSHPAVWLAFSSIHFLDFSTTCDLCLIFLANQTNFVMAPNTAIRLMHMNSAHFIP